MSSSAPGSRRLSRLPVAAAAGLALLLGACSSGTSTSAGPTTTGGGSVASSTLDSPGAPGSGPNAPEAKDPGDIPDNQAYVSYGPPSGGFVVKVPEGWARSQDGGAVTFTDKFNSIRMESRPAAAQPTVDSVKKDEVPQVQATAKAVSGVKVESVTRKAGPAVRVTFDADSPPNDVTGSSRRIAVERYDFWRAGTEVILTLTGAKGADNVDPWNIVTDGFGWTP